MQSDIEPISRILIQDDIGVALKSHHTLSLLFCEPKDVIHFQQKRGLVCRIEVALATSLQNLFATF